MSMSQQIARAVMSALHLRKPVKSRDHDSGDVVSFDERRADQRSDNFLMVSLSRGLVREREERRD